MLSPGMMNSSKEVYQQHLYLKGKSHIACAFWVMPDIFGVTLVEWLFIKAIAIYRLRSIL